MRPSVLSHVASALKTPALALVTWSVEESACTPDDFKVLHALRPLLNVNRGRQRYGDLVHGARIV